jgi:hypothetical protein
MIQSLERSMLIVKVPNYSHEERNSGFDIRFPFQIFSDHLIGRYIFKKYEDEFGKENKNIETAKIFFSKRRRFGRSLSKSPDVGIIEALSIQCPEQLKGIEFVEVAPYFMKNRFLSGTAEEAFVESIIWRNPQAFSSKTTNTLRIINHNVIQTKSGANQFFNALLSVAPIQDHPFNAELLHKHLLKFSLAKRDSWWSTFLHHQRGARGAVDRLLEWAWLDQDYSHISDGSIFLTCVALSWFLTTPSRFVRDSATKGLVCLLQNRIHLLRPLLEKFIYVNDAYVVERLFAVAYGCALRNQKNTDDLKLLAKWIYEHIFKEDRLPVHILLRDYARGVIEVALRRGIKIKVNRGIISPPYRSTWPNNIPSEAELKKKYQPDKSWNDKRYIGYLGIWLSVMSQGDFARYVIGTNSGFCAWSGRKLKNPEPNRKKLLEIFKKRLNARQKGLLEKTINPFHGINLARLLREIDDSQLDQPETSAEDASKQNEIDERLSQQNGFDEFENSLSKDLKKYFKTEIRPFLSASGNINDPFDRFDLNITQRYIFNRVIKLGYDPKLHGEFDKNVDRGGMSEHKAERIGKKYQWIAYHEFMALLSDHYEFKGYSWNDSKRKYKGPWNPRIRDIDPSFILRNGDNIKDSIELSEWEMGPGRYSAWQKHKSDIEWIKTTTDLPRPKNLLRITDDNKKEWLVLEGYVKWEDKTPPEYKRYDIPVREVWYIIKSYIVKKNDARSFFIWGKKQNFMGRWMPESHDFYEVFLGEYPDSTAFEDLTAGYRAWTRQGRGNESIPVPVVITDDRYLNEFTLDCSHSGSVSVKLPRKWLVNEMRLHHSYLDGRFYDDNNELVTIDTSIFDKEHLSALLIDKYKLLEYLTQNDYAIFWTLLSEKQLIGGSHRKEDWVGRLETSGFYTLDAKGALSGKIHHKFEN